MDLESLTKVPATLLLVHANFDEVISFAKKLLSSEGGPVPDLHILHPEGKSGNHPIESIQQLIKELSLPPYASPNKVFIIDQAERMLLPSANALLKSLEEPPQDTYLILLTAHPDQLLPTITSRCWRIDFSKQEEASVDPSFSELLQILITGREHHFSALSKALSGIEENLDQEEGALRQKKIDHLFQCIAYVYRDRHLLASSSPKFLFHQQHRTPLEANKTPLPPLEKVIALLTDARSAIHYNVKLRTCLESFFLRLQS